MTDELALRSIPTEDLVEGAGSSQPGGLAAAPREQLTTGGALIGACLDARHPTLQGRALIRWKDPTHGTREQWIPMLMTVTVRPLDRVLLLHPEDSVEPIVVGVIDGFAPRPERPATGGPTLALARDESILVQGPTGEALIELSLSEVGPVVRLLGPGVALNLPGRLSISAESVELRARQGEVALRATDDVIVAGATVRLNS